MNGIGFYHIHHAMQDVEDDEGGWDEDDVDEDDENMDGDVEDGGTPRFLDDGQVMPGLVMPGLTRGRGHTHPAQAFIEQMLGGAFRNMPGADRRRYRIVASRGRDAAPQTTTVPAAAIISSQHRCSTGDLASDVVDNCYLVIVFCHQSQCLRCAVR